MRKPEKNEKDIERMREERDWERHGKSEKEGESMREVVKEWAKLREKEKEKEWERERKEKGEYGLELRRKRRQRD